MLSISTVVVTELGLYVGLAARGKDYEFVSRLQKLNFLYSKQEDISIISVEVVR